MAQARSSNSPPSTYSYNEFRKLYRGEEENALQALPTAVEGIIQTRNYEALESVLLIHLDSLDGVKSSVIEDTKNFLTGVALIRDATAAIPLAERNHTLQFEADSFLLRALSTLRSVDFILKKTHGTDSIQSELADALTKTTQSVIALQRNAGITPAGHATAIKKLEKDFNAMLFQKLKKSNFSNTNDIHTQHDIEKVLLYLRNIASLLSPAKAMQTILKKTYETDAHKTVDLTLTETAYPITLKTPSQKMALDKLGQTHHSSDIFQTINHVFAELSKLDDRRYPAQARKTVSPTVKNGYLTETKMDVVVDGAHRATEQYNALRCGSLVYIGKTGKNVTEKEVIRDTKDNMEQLEIAKMMHKISESKTHIAMLLTYSPLQSQKHIIDGTQLAHRNMHYLPSNVDGTSRMLWVEGDLQNDLNAAGISSSPTPLDRVKRTTRVAQIINLLIHKQGVIPLITCASGQDRTGTACEASNIFWCDDLLKKYHIPLSLNDIKVWRATGLHNVMLASLAAPGSPGMKSDSQPSNTLIPNLSSDKHFFTPEINEVFYRKTANTNKKTAVDDNTKTHLTDVFNETKWAIPESRHIDEVFSLLNAYIHAAKLYQLDKASANNAGMKFFNSLVRPTATPIRNQVNRILDTDYALTLEGADTKIMTDMKERLIVEQGIHSDETMGAVFVQLKELFNLAEQQLITLNNPQAVANAPAAQQAASSR